MKTPYRFAVVSYSTQIIDLLQQLPKDEDYTMEYVSLDYNKKGLGIPELLQRYDICLIYSAFAGAIAEYLGNDVIDINKSDMDRTKALLQARRYADVIGMPVQTHEHIDYGFIEQLCGVTLHKIFYETPQDLKSGIRKAIDDGIRSFVGGGTVIAICREQNIPGIPILPSLTNLQDALVKAKNTARLKRDESLKRDQLVAIFKMFKDGVLYIGNDRRCLFANGNALSLLDIQADGVGGHTISDKTNRQIARLYEDLGVNAVLSEETPVIDQVLVLNGRTLMINAMPVTIHSDNQGVAVFMYDVNAVHDIAGKARAVQQMQGGFVAKHTTRDITGKSPVMEQLRMTIRRYAPHDAPVLIHGETGTGKDLTAQALHNASMRRNGPFVAINCSALPETLLESELFGYAEGAFTGARKGGKPGLFELAHTGTIFLDEMGELTQNTQLRLLRVLENKEIIRIGGNRVIPIDIRIISASHKSLPELVRAGQFRADLFYRLAVLRMEVPPLRHRLTDIPALVEPLLIRYGRGASCLTPRILDCMQQYSWPGNIRELRAIVESYLIMLGRADSDEDLFINLFSKWTKDFIDTPKSLTGLDLTGDLKTIMDNVRKHVAQETVARCDFNKKKAAKQLGISYNTLWRILGEEIPVDPVTGLADPASVPMGIADPAS